MFPEMSSSAKLDIVLHNQGWRPIRHFDDVDMNAPVTHEESINFWQSHVFILIRHALHADVFGDTYELWISVDEDDLDEYAQFTKPWQECTWRFEFIPTDRRAKRDPEWLKSEESILHPKNIRADIEARSMIMFKPNLIEPRNIFPVR